MKEQPYEPPFTLTPGIVRLVADISQLVGRLEAMPENAASVRLRRINRIRTIHGSLAIEGNTLTEDQITAVLDGKRITAPPREIREVKNAASVYERLDAWDPRQEKDLLAAHKLLMAGLPGGPGTYRHKGVGIMAGQQVVHMGPPAGRVPTLMKQLFNWLARAEHHPLVTGAVFHYEFEFIHPFVDGNGRMGRLWQSLIMRTWNPVCAFIPVESLVHDNQPEYYRAINESNDAGESTPFISFVLGIVRDAVTPQVAPQVPPQVKRLLKAVAGELPRDALQRRLRLKDRKSFRERYLVPALELGLIEMTIPEKPNSRLQKYRLTEAGKRAVAAG